MHIIAPIATTSGQLWANLEAFAVILYPFVEGHNGYEVRLVDRHWHDLGTALKRLPAPSRGSKEPLKRSLRIRLLVR